MNTRYTLVAGMGKTGLSIARHLARHNEPFILYDTRSQLNDQNAIKEQFPQAPFYLGDLPDIFFKDIKEVVASPGLSPKERVLQKAYERGIPVVGDVECLARLVSAPVIAITGTNGKSTVTTLVGEMAKAQGLHVAVAGNIGAPVLDVLAEEKPFDLWVLELSSFQLDLTFSLKPIAASILNISPDHLDRYSSYEAYALAKQAVYRNSLYQISNRHDALTEPHLEYAHQEMTFGLDAPKPGHWGIVHANGNTFLAKGEHLFLSVDSLKIKGTQNWQNALAACMLAEKAGIDEKSMLSVLETFKGLPHRCQWVRCLNGVDWINDSKGTNIGATQSAVTGLGEAVNGNIVLIAGGVGKGADFTALRDCIGAYVKSVVLMGEDAGKIEHALSGVADLYRAHSLEDAVGQARDLAHAGDTVLLSPACASFDMFRDFNDRGEQFEQQVMAL